MARGKIKKGDNKINGQLKSVLQKRLDEISNLSSLDLNGLYSLSQEYLSDVEIQLGPNSPVRRFSLETIKSKYPTAFPHGYNTFIEKYNIIKQRNEEIKTIMETRLISLDKEGLSNLEQRREILSQPIKLSNGDEVSLVGANFVDKDLERYKEEQRRVDIKIATLHSFDDAIKTILSSFGEKISSIGTHRPKAKEDAIMLHKSLGEMKKQVLMGELTPKEFKVQSQRKIEEALPEFKADVDLFTYLKNIMKKIASLTIGGFIPSHYQGLFKTKESEAYTGAKSLKEGIVSKIVENEVDNRKDDTQIKP